MKYNDAGSNFLDIVTGNRNGTAQGIYSVCSANREVLEACFEQATEDNSIILIESTSNQVNQFGGYTGMKPVDFVSYVHFIAVQMGFPLEKILLGGDHLGPNAWQSMTAKEAMTHASDLVADYIKAGYKKIHLDTSMPCSDDPGDRSEALSVDIVASRAVSLCLSAEDAWKTYINQGPAPIYIIGTEVPVPGGAKVKEETVHATEPEDVASTLEIFKNYFLAAGLSDAWQRVSGLVIQPGVEFGDDQIISYRRQNALELGIEILNHENLIYEAHSTDYQSESNLRAMVKDHFGILKVGPWLTFAYREALFSLESMEKIIMGINNLGLSDLSAVLESSMIKKPVYWSSYYHGNEEEKSFRRKYSFSDRSRYYWTDPEVENARIKLYTNLLQHKIPLSLLSQFMPSEFLKVCNEEIYPFPAELVHSHIRTVLGIYSRACRLSHG